MATADLFRELGPEYAALADDVIVPWLTRAGIRIDADFNGAYRNDAVALLALHLYTMAQPASAGGGGGVGGVVARRRARNWEIAYAQGGASSSTGGDSFEQTSYGRQYLELLHIAGMGAPQGLFPSTVVLL